MSSEITQILTALCAGDHSGFSRLFDIVYYDLRRIARRSLGHTALPEPLQPTELVHEAFLKLVAQEQVDWRGKSHFYAVGAQACGTFWLIMPSAKRARNAAADGSACRSTKCEPSRFMLTMTSWNSTKP